MTVQPSSLTKHKAGAHDNGSPAPPPAPTGQAGEDLRRLGEALNARCKDVLEQTVARSRESGHVLGGAAVRHSFERICTISTIAVAKWMAGGSPEAGLEAGREAWQIFGQLAAQRAEP